MSSDREKAIDISKRFFGFEPRHIRKIDFKMPRAVAKLGTAVRLDYVSDKFDGVKRIYWHKFKKPPAVYVLPDTQKNGDNVIIIRGKFRIKKEGITG
jgi:hypothetical protein